MALKGKSPSTQEAKQERDFRLARETGQREDVRRFIKYVDRICVSFGQLTLKQVVVMPFEERYTVWLSYIDLYNRAQTSKRRAATCASETHFTKEDIRDLRTISGGKCAYCGCNLGPQEEHIEHVVPLSRGGSNGPKNIVLACERCNLSKGAKTPEEWTNRWYLMEDTVN